MLAGRKEILCELNEKEKNDPGDAEEQKRDSM